MVSAMVSTLLLLGLFVAVVALAALATWTRLPYAILLVLGGLALGFMPGLPAITLNPDLVLLLFLPPLVYSSAWLTSWREFRTSLRPILLLAVGLVLATTVVVALVAHAALGLSWSVAFVLGAVVSPTDAVAASATAQRLGLSRRILTIIEGESIVNDATGLVVYRFAIAAVISGAFSLWQASLQFFVVSIGGLIVGLVIAVPLAWVHRRLDDAPIEITLTLLTPFAVYALAQALSSLRRPGRPCGRAVFESAVLAHVFVQHASTSLRGLGSTGVCAERSSVPAYRTAAARRSADGGSACAPDTGA